MASVKTLCAFSTAAVYGLRAPAYPLIVQSPLSLSVWSGADNLTDVYPNFWGGQVLGFVGMIRIDGVPYRWMGVDSNTPSGNTSAMQQTASYSMPTTTMYTFQQSGVQLNVSFTTPITDDLLTWMLNPVTYLQLSVAAVDGASHRVSMLFAHTAEASINDIGTFVQWQRDTPRSVPSAQVMRVGSAAQDVLGASGDRMRTSWGFQYLAVPTATTAGTAAAATQHDGPTAAATALPSGPPGTVVTTSMSGSRALITAFAQSQPLPADDTRQPRACDDDWVMLGVEWDLPTLNAAADGDNNGSTAAGPGSSRAAVGSSGSPAVVSAVITYDEVKSMEYYGAQLSPFWTTAGDVIDMIGRAINNGTAQLAAAAAFDAALWDQLLSAGGQQYAELASLAYRQVYGAMTFTVPPGDLPYGCGYDNGGTAPLSGGAWAFMEEQSSDGDVSTVDVLYPASPAILYFHPELQAALNLPVIEYARNCTPVDGNGQPSSPYLKSFAPHDLGTWPIAGRAWNNQEDMPVEESGNLLILSAAVYNLTGSTSFLAPGHLAMLEQWALFVNTSLPTPPAQLCTDDFEGPAPNNTNLVIKGITALGAYAQLLDAAGRGPEAAQYRTWAASHVQYWLANAYTPANPVTGYLAHYKRQYELNSTSYSLKYNTIYGYFLGLVGSDHWFDDSLMTTEFTFYSSANISKPYGPPLDDRNVFTLVEYLGDLLGVAGAMSNRGVSGAAQWQAWLTTSLYNFARDTPQRVPMTDWYNAETSAQWGFQARATVGDIFALALVKNRSFGAARAASAQLAA